MPSLGGCPRGKKKKRERIGGPGRFELGESQNDVVERSGAFFPRRWNFSDVFGQKIRNSLGIMEINGFPLIPMDFHESP